MKMNHLALVVGILAIGISSAASAQNLEVITIQSKRALTTKVVGLEAAPPAGMPMMEISLSYDLSTAGFDLATPAGAQAFEKRVRDVADAVCKEIGRQYPQSKPGDEECARNAVHRAMVQAHKLEKAAAQKHSG